MKSYKEFVLESDINSPLQNTNLTSVDTMENGGIYKHTGTGDYVIPSLKRVFLRAKGRKTSNNDWAINKNWAQFLIQQPEPIGWFSTKNNPALGAALYPLDKLDRDYLRKGGIKNFLGIVRFSTEKGHNIGKFNLKTGVWAPISYNDGEDYNDKGESTFQKQVAYEKVVLDSEDAFHYFGFTFKQD